MSTHGRTKHWTEVLLKLGSTTDDNDKKWLVQLDEEQCRQHTALSGKYAIHLRLVLESHDISSLDKCHFSANYDSTTPLTSLLFLQIAASIVAKKMTNFLIKNRSSRKQSNRPHPIYLLAGTPVMEEISLSIRLCLFETFLSFAST